jgi:hypothetical protein
MVFIITPSNNSTNSYRFSTKCWLPTFSVLFILMATSSQNLFKKDQPNAFGLKWGDFAVFNREELFEVLAERAARSGIKSEPIKCEPKREENQVIVERAAPCSVTTYKEESPFVPLAKKEPLRAKLDKFLTPKRTLCVGCGTFCVHSKPPENWNAADRKRYCCLGCRDSAGKKHADRCQKHKY